MRINAPWVYEPMMGNKTPGGRHVVTDNNFYPFCWFPLDYASFEYVVLIICLTVFVFD